MNVYLHWLQKIIIFTHEIGGLDLFFWTETKYVRNVFIESKNVPPGSSSDPFCQIKFQFDQQKYQQS